MLDIGWSEMLVIAAIAIVVIGPKDLPATLRAVGRWVAKARAAAREFQSGIDQMVADAELDELKKTATSVRDFDADSLLDKVDPTGGADEKGPTGASPTSGGDPAAAGEPAASSADSVATHIDDAEAGARIDDELPPAQVAPPHSLMHAGQAVDYMPPSEGADDRGDGDSDGDADAQSPAEDDAATPRRAGGADA